MSAPRGVPQAVTLLPVACDCRRRCCLLRRPTCGCCLPRATSFAGTTLGFRRCSSAASAACAAQQACGDGGSSQSLQRGRRSATSPKQRGTRGNAPTSMAAGAHPAPEVHVRGCLETGRAAPHLKQARRDAKTWAWHLGHALHRRRHQPRRYETRCRSGKLAWVGRMQLAWLAAVWIRLPISLRRHAPRAAHQSPGFASDGTAAPPSAFATATA